MSEGKGQHRPLDLEYVQYNKSREPEFLPAIRQLISKDLSEPYSIYVYRYFLYQWGDLCFMVGGLILSDIRPRKTNNLTIRHWTMMELS